MRDTVGLVLCEMGKDPANFTDADFDAAIAMIQKAKDAGQLKGFTGNDYTDGLTKGDIAACIAWTGDVVQLQVDNDKLQYVLPAGRVHAVVGQLRDPGAGQAQEERRDAHQLLLRPGRHGAGRGLGQLHPAGQGHQGGAGQGRPGDGRQPPDLPERRGPVPGQRLPGPDGRGGDQVHQRPSPTSPPADGGARDRRPPARRADQDVRRVHRRAPPRPDHPAGLVLRAARPVGLRQDDDAADGRRPRAAQRRPDPHRRHGHHRHPRLPAQRQHGVPVLRALPAHERHRQRRVRAAPPW